jgi:hypothetical protein
MGDSAAMAAEPKIEALSSDSVAPPYREQGMDRR